MIILNQVLALNAQFMKPSGTDVLTFLYLEALLFVCTSSRRERPNMYNFNIFVFFIYLLGAVMYTAQSMDISVQFLCIFSSCFICMLAGSVTLQLSGSGFVMT